MMLEVFSNLNDSVILLRAINCAATHTLVQTPFCLTGTFTAACTQKQLSGKAAAIKFLEANEVNRVFDREQL